MIGGDEEMTAVWEVWFCPAHIVLQRSDREEQHLSIPINEAL